jgi:hypothetical protein
MSDADYSKLIMGSMFDSFLNYDDNSSSITTGTASVGAGHFAHYSISVPIDNDKDFSQLQLNYSFDNSKWYIYPVLDLTLNSNFSVTTVANYNNSNLIVNIYVVNQSGSTNTHPSFTVIAHPYLIATPS